MDNFKQAMNILGLAMRAGMVTSGGDLCEKAARGKNAGILLLDSGSSENTLDRFQGICKGRQLPMYLLPQDALGSAIGKPGRMVAVVAKGALCQKLATLLQGGSEG